MKWIMALLSIGVLPRQWLWPGTGIAIQMSAVKKIYLAQIAVNLTFSFPLPFILSTLLGQMYQMTSTMCMHKCENMHTHFFIRFIKLCICLILCYRCVENGQLCESLISTVTVIYKRMQKRPSTSVCILILFPVKHGLNLSMRGTARRGSTI